MTTSEMTIMDARAVAFGPTSDGSWLDAPLEVRKGYGVRYKAFHDIRCTFYYRGQLMFWTYGNGTGQEIGPLEIVVVTYGEK